MTPLFISFKVVGGDKWVMSKLRQTTILRPFFDIFERLLETQFLSKPRDGIWPHDSEMI